MKLILFFSLVILSITYPAFSQLSYEVLTDKETYQYGEKIVITGRVYNHSDTTVTIISNTNGFIIPTYFNNAILNRYGLPLEVPYDVPAKSFYSIRFIIDPQQMGLPNKDGLNQVISHISWFYQPFTSGFSGKDTVEFNAPAFPGGELFLTYLLDSLSNIQAIKDSMNATVMQSDTSHFNGMITEQWQTSGYILDSLLARFGNTGGILDIYPNRFLFADSFFVTGLDKPQRNPVNYRLNQNYPNPFNPQTIIEYSVQAYHDMPVRIELSIYNLLGQKVTTLVNKKHTAGKYRVEWDATDQPSGIYFYRLQTGNFSQTKKMMLLR